MNESRSSLYSLLTGLAGGMAAWTGIEIILWQAPAFPDLRILTLSLGAVAGLLLGAVAPMSEGLRQNQPRKVITGIAVGSITGLLFGALGMAAGQLILSMLADSAAITGAGLASYGAAFARIPGWIILGTAVGAASGIRSRSPGRIAAGAAGGFLGGLIGGIAAELLTGITEGIYGRGVGMLLWGTAVAFLADRMESRRARGRLTVLTGPLKGRSFPVNQNKLRIARSVSADLTIPGDPADAESTLVGDAALVRLKKGTVVLEPSKKAKVEINGEKAGTTELRYDDIVKIDGVTLIYEAKR